MRALARPGSLIMKVTAKSVLKGTSVACALLLATSGQALATPIYAHYTGSGWDTHIDNLDDGFPVNMTIAEATGSFGVSRIDISAEFVLEDPNDPDDTAGIECEEGYGLLVGFLSSTQIATFKNHDQLYGFSDNGWMCVSQTTGQWYGKAQGFYFNGTGRFAGANGTWETTFEGMNLELPEAVTGLEPIGFRSITGKISGNVNMHGPKGD